MWILITYEWEFEQSKALRKSVVIALLVGGCEYEKWNERANNKGFMCRAAVRAVTACNTPPPLSGLLSFNERICMFLLTAWDGYNFCVFCVRADNVMWLMKSSRYASPDTHELPLRFPLYSLIAKVSASALECSLSTWNNGLCSNYSHCRCDNETNKVLLSIQISLLKKEVAAANLRSGIFFATHEEEGGGGRNNTSRFL